MNFPNLSAAKLISIDVESKDPELETKGPGYQRGDAYVAGISVGTDDGYREYFPIRHETGDNLEPSQVLAWAKDQFTRPGQPKVGANLLYDLEALAHEGVQVAGPFLDVQLAEPLLDEHAFSYALDTLGKRYCGEGKDEAGLYSYCAEHFGGKPNRSQQAKNIWRAPGHIVRPYAISDVDLPLKILDHQMVSLKEQGLTELFDLECSLIPLLLAMRQRGVRVDVERAQYLSDFLGRKLKASCEELYRLCKQEINYHAAESIAPVFDRLNISYPITPKSHKPSFDTAWLEAQDHPIAKCIVQCRKYDKIKTTFVDGYVLESHINGRVHGQFHQLRADKGNTGKKGAVSGRFSSSNPNLENIPTRDKETIELLDIAGCIIEMGLGKAVRSLFLPDEGETWAKDDYSQIEYRLICHYGKGPSAEAARRAYIENPNTDFHQWVADIAGIERGPAKTINFGKAYGMGVASTAEGLGVSLKEARKFIKTYDGKMPFVKDLLETAMGVASSRGYVKTILGRRARFNLWEPKFSYGRNKPCPYEEAKKQWGDFIQRAKAYKALNAICQGSAADVFKTALRNMLDAGILAVLHAPLNLVHDEVDWSLPDTKLAREAHFEAVRIMENAIKFRVPLVVESEYGPNWGEVKKL